MNKNKVLCALLAVSMLSASGAVFAEESTGDIMLISEAAQQPAEKRVAGHDKTVIEGTAKITDENELYIIDAAGTETVLLTGETTLFTTSGGNRLTRDDIKDGDSLRAVVTDAMTMSLPAQTYTYVVMKADEEAAFPIYAEIDTIETDEDGNTVLYTADGMYKVVYGEETVLSPFMTKNIVSIADIKKGSRLLVYSNLMTMSIPALVPAEKIVVLPEIIQETEEAKPEKVILNGEELDADIQDKDGTYMLPVRAICEKAGLAVEWDDTLKAISVGTIPMGVSFNIGENSYSKARMMPMTLSSEPILVNDRTYVPADFFTEVLGAEVKTESGAVSISLTVSLD